MTVTLISVLKSGAPELRVKEGWERAYYSCTHHEKFVPSRRISYPLSYVRVALAALDVQSVLEMPATDEIHMEDRNHGLA